MTEYRFGYWEGQGEYVGNKIIIRPLPNFPEIKALADERAHRGKQKFFPRIIDGYEGAPVPEPRFELPVTHVLSTPGRNRDDEFGEFLVLVMGFLHGLRLTPEGVGHLFPTPWQEGHLVAFTPWRHEVVPCMEAALATWDGLTSIKRTLLFSAVHWHLVAQSYPHEFERFNWQYSVLDNLHRLRPGSLPGHGNRPTNLSNQFGSPLPHIFQDRKNTPPKPNGYLSELRNELVHEGRWLGEPLGYVVGPDAHDTLEELTYFNSQIILGVLGINCTFRSLRYSRQPCPLDLCP